LRHRSYTAFAAGKNAGGGSLEAQRSIVLSVRLVGYFGVAGTFSAFVLGISLLGKRGWPHNYSMDVPRRL
jgi:hypothetical protein